MKLSVAFKPVNGSRFLQICPSKASSTSETGELSPVGSSVGVAESMQGGLILETGLVSFDLKLGLLSFSSLFLITGSC